MDFLTIFVVYNFKISHNLCSIHHSSVAECWSVDLEVPGSNPGWALFLFQVNIHTFGEIIFHDPFKDISVNFFIETHVLKIKLVYSWYKY